MYEKNNPGQRLDYFSFNDLVDQDLGAELTMAELAAGTDTALTV
jgi:hypothetical protein